MAERKPGAGYSDALIGRPDYLVDQTVLGGLRGAQEVVAIGVFFDLFDRFWPVWSARI